MTNKIILTLAMAFTGVTAINARNISADPISKTPSFEESSPVVITLNASFLMPGEDVQVNILATSSSLYTVKEIKVGGATVMMRDGFASCKLAGGGLGNHEIPVTVSFIENNGKLQLKTYTVKYEVGMPNTSIALDKMNVLFIGVDNPVSISTSAGADEAITVKTEGGGSTITKLGPGKYSVRVTEMTDKCVVNVYVDGKAIAASEFKVRNLPVPIATVGGYSSGDVVDAAKFGAQAGVGTYVKDFPVSFRCGVESYTVAVTDGKGETKTVNCEGAAFSADASKIIKEAKSGSTLIIGNIMAKDEGGRKMKLAPIVYYIK